jgi:hypothetical protein
VKRTTGFEPATFGLGGTFWRFCGVAGWGSKEAGEQGFFRRLSGAVVRSKVTSVKVVYEAAR